MTLKTPSSSLPSLLRRTAPAPLAGALVAAGLAAVGLGAAPAVQAGPPTDPETVPAFTRVDVDAGVTGASFTVVGEVFAGEQNIVTVGYGALVNGGPSGGGTVQVYRPGVDITDWHKVPVVDRGDDIVFPNQVTMHDMDGDGDNDLVVPGGNFFDTNPFNTNPHGSPISRGTITWWENEGLDAAGQARPFTRHDVITAQPWSYHSVQVVDLNGDGVDDLLSVGEQGRSPSHLDDDLVSMQFFAGLGGASFAAPVQLADVGGSIPVVHDVDGDDDLDIVSSQYFDTGSGAEATPATFLWLEQVADGAAGLSAADFTPHTIATRLTTPAGRGVGPGFQIRPVPDFRGDGETAWVGTNHTNRCTLTSLPPEEVFELIPGADPREQWTIETLSNPAVSTPACPAEYPTMPIFPGDDITSRYGYGQAAPGVFGYGDVDGDGDIDLAVSGDGDRRLFWIEQKGDGSTLLHTLTAPGEEFGQSGGAIVADLNADGVNELIFSSFDKSTVALWHRGALPAPTETPTTLQASATATPVKAGATKPVAITLTGLDSGAHRRVSVTTISARTGRPIATGSVVLTRTAAGRYAGTARVRGLESGTVKVAYATSQISQLARETGSTASTTIRVTTVISGFSKRTTTKRQRVTLQAKISPGAKRKVVVQQQVCGAKRCTWRKRAVATTSAKGVLRVSVKAPRGTSKWRLKATADTSGSAATSVVKRVVRR